MIAPGTGNVRRQRAADSEVVLYEIAGLRTEADIIVCQDIVITVCAAEPGGAQQETAAQDDLPLPGRHLQPDAGVGSGCRLGMCCGGTKQNGRGNKSACRFLHMEGRDGEGRKYSPPSPSSP